MSAPNADNNGFWLLLIIMFMNNIVSSNRETKREAKLLTQNEFCLFGFLQEMTIQIRGSVVRRLESVQFPIPRWTTITNDYSQLKSFLLSVMGYEGIVRAILLDFSLIFNFEMFFKK